MGNINAEFTKCKKKTYICFGLETKEYGQDIVKMHFLHILIKADYHSKLKFFIYYLPTEKGTITQY